MRQEYTVDEAPVHHMTPCTHTRYSHQEASLQSQSTYWHVYGEESTRPLEEHERLCKDSNPSSRWNWKSWSCEAATLYFAMLGCNYNKFSVNKNNKQIL